jgi:hypothetical protein
MCPKLVLVSAEEHVRITQKPVTFYREWGLRLANPLSLEPDWSCQEIRRVRSLLSDVAGDLSFAKSAVAVSAEIESVLRRVLPTADEARRL